MWVIGYTYHCDEKSGGPWRLGQHFRRSLSLLRKFESLVLVRGLGYNYAIIV
jgi:hypothetical protein